MSFVFEIIQQHTFLFEIVYLLFTENSVFGIFTFKLAKLEDVWVLWLPWQQCKNFSLKELCHVPDWLDKQKGR